MGRELICTVRVAGKTARGKALLETNELVFRGEPRFKIPLGSVQKVTACDGELHLRWPNGSAVFELGDHAEKWAHTILHPKSTAEKLGIKPWLTISALGDFDPRFLAELQTGAAKFSNAKPLKDSDLIFLAAHDAGDLGRAAKVVPSLGAGGALWIVYPKGRTEIKGQQVLAAGKQAGLVDVKVVSFSATHTALKFARPKMSRKALTARAGLGGVLQ